MAFFTTLPYSFETNPRAFYCTKVCEKSKSATFLYYKKIVGRTLWGIFVMFTSMVYNTRIDKRFQQKSLQHVGLLLPLLAKWSDPQP